MALGLIHSREPLTFLGSCPLGADDVIITKPRAFVLLEASTGVPCLSQLLVSTPRTFTTIHDSDTHLDIVLRATIYLATDARGWA